MKEEEFNYILKLIDIMIEPCSCTERSISTKNYLSAYENNQMLEYIQYISEDDYINLTKNLIEDYYQKNKVYYIKVLFDSFFFYIQNIEYYIAYIEWIEQVKNDFPQFQKHLTVIQNLIFHFLYYEKSLELQKYNVGNLDINEFLDYFDITWFREKHVYFESDIENTIDIIRKNINSSIYEVNFNTDNHLIGSKLKLITTFSYEISRHIMYKADKKQREKFFSIFIPKLKSSLDTYLDVIKKNGVFFIAIYRIFSLISAYYNIYIKYIIDTKGKRNKEINHKIDEYFDIMNDMYDILIGSISTNVIHRMITNFVEIVNYYNYCGLNILGKLKTPKYEINNFSEFYKERVLSVQHSKIGFGYIIQLFYSNYSLRNFNTSVTALFETSVFLLSYILVYDGDTDGEIKDNIHAFKESFNSLYDFDKLSDLVKPSIEPNHVWF